MDPEPDDSLQLEFELPMVERACLQNGLVPTEAILDQVHQDMVDSGSGLLDASIKRVAIKVAETN